MKRRRKSRGRMQQDLYKHKGFTLIEVIVVIGIISLMVGIMIPMVYRVWESQEIDTTKERMQKIKDAMVGNPSHIGNGTRSNFGFVGDLGQLPPDLDALIVYGTYGPYLSGGIDPGSFKKDAWNNDLIYTYQTDSFSRRGSAVIKSFGSDNSPGGIGTAEDIILAVDINEVLPAYSISCNVLVRFMTAPSSTFNATITVHIIFKNGEGAEIEQTLSSPVTVTANEGNPQNNYSFGLSSTLSPKLPVGVSRIWADIDKDSSGNPLGVPAVGPENFIALNDRVSTFYAGNLSISSP